MNKEAEKAEYRRLVNECRELWNAFDPIGVLELEDGPLDEYDSYLLRTVSLATSGSDTSALMEYLRYVVHERMGLIPTVEDSDSHGIPF